MPALSQFPRTIRGTRHAAGSLLRAATGIIVALVTVMVASAPNNAFGQGPVHVATRPPKITQQPASLTVEQGQSAAFQVEVDEEKFEKGSLYNPYSYGTITYQWMKNGVRVTGATSATLILNNVQASDAGAYFLVVSNQAGWVASNTVSLTVIIPIPATILTQPMGTTLNEGQTATFSVVAQGTPAPTYRWRKNGTPIAGATRSILTLGNVQLADTGSYDVLVANSRHSALSRAAALRVIEPGTSATTQAQALEIVTQPISAALNPGENAAFNVAVHGHDITYQWKKNGHPMPGGTGPALTLPVVRATDMGFYSVVVSRGNVSLESDHVVLTVAIPGMSRLTNVSTRGIVTAGGSLTPGFTLRGTGTAQLLIRAVGPTLAAFGLVGACVDPRLELIRGGETAAALANDNWSASEQLGTTTAAVGAFTLQTGSKDAAVLASLPSLQHQSYTARVTADAAGQSGIVLAEVYDSGGPDAPVRLAAVSTLGRVAAGDGALVSGFTIQGSAPKRLLVRAVGPELAQFGVTDSLADPRFSIFPSGGDHSIASNDNWAGDAAIAGAASAHSRLEARMPSA
jgi:hypothetical protein